MNLNVSCWCKCGFETTTCILEGKCCGSCQRVKLQLFDIAVGYCTVEIFIWMTSHSHSCTGFTLNKETCFLSSIGCFFFSCSCMMALSLFFLFYFLTIIINNIPSLVIFSKYPAKPRITKRKKHSVSVKPTLIKSKHHLLKKMENDFLSRVIKKKKTHPYYTHVLIHPSPVKNRS